MEKSRDRAVIILFSGDLDKALACFNIATTAASMGMDVTIFFTFWGLNAITKPGRAQKKGIIRKMFALVNRTGARSLKLSRFNFLGAGTYMMKKLMKQEKMPSLEELIQLAKTLGVKFIACTTTCSIMGVTRDKLIEEVDEMAGAATFVEEARSAKFALFI